MKPSLRSRLKYRGEQCLNCGTALDRIDKYCHQCGQLNTTKRLALVDFFKEFFANFFAYDSRIWRTITQILFKPGYVTTHYCAGKRVRYANPFRFFLSVSIVFFLLFLMNLRYSNNSFKNIKDSIVTANDTVVNDSDKTLAQLKSLKDSLNRSNVSVIKKEIVNQLIEQVEAGNEDKKDKEYESYISQEKLDSLDFLHQYTEQINNYQKYYDYNKTKSIESSLKSLGHRIDDTNYSRFDKAVRFTNLSDNPFKIVEILLPKIPIFLFFFVPVLSLMFWLLYARHDWNFMEHMVFNFHFFTFIFLCMYIVALEKMLFNTGILLLLFFGLIGPFYLYKAMRNFYQQGRFRTIVKFLIINFVFLFLLTTSSSLFLIASIYLDA